MATEELLGVDPSNLPDFFRISPWSPEELQKALLRFLFSFLKSKNISAEQALFLTLDDSLTIKDNQTSKLQSVDWIKDHNTNRYVKASVHVVLGIHWGGYHFPLSWRLYLREKTFRRLNRRRKKNQRLRYTSKISLAKEMLEQVQELLPNVTKVYVLFDSWYAAGKFIRWIVRQVLARHLRVPI
ncbi:MAG: transposase [Gemmataceae bacterium]